MPHIVGTDADLQPSYTVEASTPGEYEFELIATDAINEASAIPVALRGRHSGGQFVPRFVGAGFFEDNISGPITTFLYCGNSTSNVDMTFDVALNGPEDSGTSVFIDWGDGASTLTDLSAATVSHTYAPGSWQITMTVEHGSNGLGLPCPKTTVYNVFVGTAPNVSLTLAAADVCLNNPIAEVVLGNNSLTELTWEVQFNDGSEATALEPTTDDDISVLHTFAETSCDVDGGFELRLTL